jgi:hypothetical protein
VSARLGHGIVAAILALQAIAEPCAILRLPTSVRDASRALAAGTRHWPAEHKRIVGDSADTLALERICSRSWCVNRSSWGRA